MSGFRQPEAPRDQIVLWSRKWEDAPPPDHPVRRVGHNSGPELAALEEMKVVGLLPDSGESSGPKKGKNPKEVKRTEEALAAARRSDQRGTSLGVAPGRSGTHGQISDGRSSESNRHQRGESLYHIRGCPSP
jgi:hypothetical protein